MGRNYKSKDIKLLWGLSGGICAKCKMQLIDYDCSIVLAHQAHVIARKAEKLPSYEAIALEEKDTYMNMVLMCPSCHVKTTDGQKKSYLN